jgi:hypothetical protein
LPDVGRGYSPVSAIAVGLGVVALVVASIGLGVAVTALGEVDEIAKQLREAHTTIAALELEQRQLNDRIGDATEAAAIAKAILELSERR